jgi:hypothetical protein
VLKTPSQLTFYKHCRVHPHLGKRLINVMISKSSDFVDFGKEKYKTMGFQKSRNRVPAAKRHGRKKIIQD